MAEPSYRRLLWGLAAAGTALDQVTKYGVFKWLHDSPSLYDPERWQGHYQVIPGAFELLAQFTGKTEAGSGALARLRTVGGDSIPMVNQGALFGFGRDYALAANTVFALVSVVAALAIIYWSQRPSTAREWSLCAALGLILAGTLGNLYDRLIFDGVRDWLHFYWFEWPVFNVADCCLVFGAFLLLGQAFWGKPAAAPAGAEATAATELAEAT
jgi:lipoprotein signal peptidase